MARPSYPIQWQIPFPASSNGHIIFFNNTHTLYKEQVAFRAKPVIITVLASCQQSADQTSLVWSATSNDSNITISGISWTYIMINLIEMLPHFTIYTLHLLASRYLHNWGGCNHSMGDLCMARCFVRWRLAVTHYWQWHTELERFYNLYQRINLCFPLCWKH